MDYYSQRRFLKKKMESSKKPAHLLSFPSQYCLCNRAANAIRSQDACRLNDVSCACRHLVVLRFPKLLSTLYTDG